MIEIRLHGRGGQGTVVASQILAVAAAKDGKRSQSFSSFGAERRGAPVQSFVRIDSKPILTHSRIYEPDVVVLMDASLIGGVNVLEGLKPGGTLLINSSRLPEPLRDVDRFKVALVDADSIAREIRIGPSHSPIINTAMLGAISALPGLVSVDAIKAAIRDYFAERSEVNVQAAERASGSVRFLDRVPKLVLEEEELVREAKPVGDVPTPVAQKRRGVPLSLDKSAPCREACPIGTDMEGAMRLLEEGRLGEAWELILEENPFPAVTGRVCFHPCQTACNRKQFDEAVAINSLEQYLGDWGLSNDRVIKRPAGRREFRIAVVGAGLAGLSSAYHLLRLGHSVTIFDSLPDSGGILRYGIPPYRLPDQVLVVLDDEIARLTALGVDWRLSAKVGRDVSVEKLLEYDAVYVGLGAQEIRRLEMLGEDSRIVLSELRGLQNAAGRVFAADDLLPQPRTVAFAIGSGKRAAVSIDMAVRGLGDEGQLVSLKIGAKGNISTRDYRGQPVATRSLENVVSLKDLNLAYFSKCPSLVANRAGADLTSDQALYEARRCFHCGRCTLCENCYIFCPDAAVQDDEETGRPTIQAQNCKSCGICVRECPRGILTLERR